MKNAFRIIIGVSYLPHKHTHTLTPIWLYVLMTKPNAGRTPRRAIRTTHHQRRHYPSAGSSRIVNAQSTRTSYPKLFRFNGHWHWCYKRRLTRRASRPDEYIPQAWLVAQKYPKSYDWILYRIYKSARLRVEELFYFFFAFHLYSKWTFG